jgi:hypothetical protein
MEHARHQALAGPCFAMEQHRRDGGIAQGIKGCEVLNLGTQGRDGRARPDEAVGGMARGLGKGETWSTHISSNSKRFLTGPRAGPWAGPWGHHGGPIMR